MCLLETAGLLSWKCFDRLLYNNVFKVTKQNHLSQSLKTFCWWYLIYCLVWRSIKRLNLHSEKFFLHYLHLGALLTAKV